MVWPMTSKFVAPCHFKNIPRWGSLRWNLCIGGNIFLPDHCCLGEHKFEQLKEIEVSLLLILSSIYRYWWYLYNTCEWITITHNFNIYIYIYIYIYERLVCGCVCVLALWDITLAKIIANPYYKVWTIDQGRRYVSRWEVVSHKSLKQQSSSSL